MALQLDFTVTAISAAVTNARYEIKKDGVTSVATGLIDIPSNGVMALPMEAVDVLAKDLVSIHLDDFNGSNSADAQSCFGWATITNDDITSAANGEVVTFINPTYVVGTWSFGDGSPTTSTVDPIYHYGSGGTFNVVFTSDVGVEYPVTLNLTYRGEIDAVVTNEATVSFTNPTNITGTWDFGDGSATTTTVSPVYDYVATGSFNVVFTSSTGVVYTITVSTVYIGEITATVSYSEATFTNPINTTGTWDFGDGSTTTTVDPVYDYGTAGTFNVVFISSTNVNYTVTASSTWSIHSIFDGGNNGVRYDSKIESLFQDAAGTAAVTAAGDPVGFITDKSPNALNATQSVSARRPTYSTTPYDNLSYDLVDDEMIVPLVAGDYTLFQQSTHGLLEATITTTGDWTLESVMGSVSELIVVDGTPDKSAIRGYLNNKHVDNGFSGLTDFSDQSGPFSQRSDLTSLDLSNWDFSNFTTLYTFLYLCRNLTDVNLGIANTLNVTDFQHFMRNSQMLVTLDVSNMDTSSAITMNNFAYGCTSLTTLAASNWDTSSVTNFSQFAWNCISLTNLGVSNWDTSSVTNFSYFAYDCTSLTTLDVSNWDTSNVTDFYQFMFGCTSLTTLDVSNWNTSSVTNFSQFAYRCLPLTNLGVSNWDTSSVTNFNQFARQCEKLTTLDVSNWDTSNVTDFYRFAYGCTSLTTLDVSNWNTANVTDFNQFMLGCTSLTTLDVSNWNTANVTDFSQFAKECVKLTSLDAGNWNTAKITDFYQFAYGCTSLTTLAASNWDTANVTNFGSFARECAKLTTLDVSNWDTSNVTDFSVFTYRCSELTTILVNGGTGNPFADSPCTDYNHAFRDTNLTQQSIDDILVAINAAGTSNGSAIYFQSEGSAPSATGNAAIDGLRSRGWTIDVTGGY